ncbi:MAG TPA: hypothetical protein VNT23_04685, partial [Gaiellaceae bacterium]|nr:hypothetical protein [Gaiellaceae bacterium]
TLGGVPPRSNGRTSNGLVLAVLVSAAATFVGWQVVPRLELPFQNDAPVPAARVITLGAAAGFDAVGRPGSRWCVPVEAGSQVCALTGSGESGREALTRVLRAAGYTVR